MKILVNAISAKQGGIVTYTVNLMRSLRDRGVEAVFAVPPKFPKIEGVSTIHTEAARYSASRRFLWEQAVWRRVVARIRPDVLYSSANFSLFKSPVPQLLLVREGGLFDPFYLVNVAPNQGMAAAARRIIRRNLMILSALQADHILTPTATMRDMLILWRPEIAQRCSVIHYGTLPEMFSPARGERGWREDGILRLLYVSIYYPHKMPWVVSEAARSLDEQGLSTRATITMTLEEIKSLSGGALDAKILGPAVEANLATLCHSDYQELPAVYRKHDVFVFPSVSETFGHPMVEAMSSGIPVVAADTSVNREICGDAALYFTPCRASELCARLKELDASPALREELVRRGRQRILELFDWERHVDGLIETCRRVAHAGKG